MAIVNDTVTKLSPDGFSRFYVLADLLSQLYPKGSTVIRILDVGGGSEFLDQQLQGVGLNYELTILDIIPRPATIKTNYIQDDATNMQLADDSYDVVLSTDTLEHIPPKRKQAFLDECLRVAKEVCIIAAPFNTNGVHEAEVAVNEFNKELFGSGQNWLEEHLKYGKPELELFTTTLSKEGLKYIDFGTQNLTTWLLNTHINLIDAKLGLDKTAHLKANTFYNQNILSMNEFSEPTYRHFFVIYKDTTKQPLVNPKRYTEAQQDGQKIARYTNMLMDLLAHRILSLTTLNKQLRAEVQVNQDKLLTLKELSDKQAATLKAYEPLINAIRRLPFRSIYLGLRDKRKDRAK